ncbi:MAG TPA: energy-coupling factor ABC transporter ATP-binding protein [Candidatus Angelobacter sp.]|nr:energy-coupling factor ABC transporter ATP-binding protein [Candidatus Angelobacter sp.]
MKRASIIEVKNLYFRYRQEISEWSLENVSLNIKRGEWVAIIGQNGSGKSTLAKCLNGLFLPEKGDVLVNQLSTLIASDLLEIRRSVGLIFQNPDNQFVGATVRDDVAFGMENHGIPREVMIQRIDDSLERVGMTDYMNQEPHRLSGGQKQRVAIAGILALRPSIVILDEATSMLDPKGRQDVIELMRRLNTEFGITVVSITHDLEEAALADRIVVLNKGKVLREGTPGDVFSNSAQLHSIGLDLPFAVKMRDALRKEQVQIASGTFREEELVEAIWSLL